MSKMDRREFIKSTAYGAFSIVLLILMPIMCLAYEQGMLNLKTPTNLEKGQKEFTIQHRFCGKVDEEPFETFFGMDLGANNGIDLRYMVWSKLELNVSYIRDRKERTIGASYAYSFPKTSLQSQIDFQFFSYKKYSGEKKHNIFGLFSMQSEPILNRIIPVVNFGYDCHNRKPGAGLGLTIVAFEKLGIIWKVSVIGEYFPIIVESENKDCFAFGIRLETYAHHFDLLLSNNWKIGTRNLMLGTETEGLYFGFNIKRLL